MLCIVPAFLKEKVSVFPLWEEPVQRWLDCFAIPSACLQAKMNGKEEKMWEDEPQWDDPPPPRPPYVYRPSWADQFPHLVNAATEEDKAQAGRNALEFMQLGGSFRVGRLTT